MRSNYTARGRPFIRMFFKLDFCNHHKSRFFGMNLRVGNLCMRQNDR